MSGARSGVGGVDSPLVVDSSDSDDNLPELSLSGRVKRVNGKRRLHKNSLMPTRKSSKIIVPGP